jgi:hypothetical protein
LDERIKQTERNAQPLLEIKPGSSEALKNTKRRFPEFPSSHKKTLHPNVTENSNVFALLFYLKLRTFNWLL